MEETPFIAIEGPIGAGKTTLATAIANHFQFSLLKEIVDENPFLEKFYENIEDWSFQTEMFFLCNRYKQLTDIEKHHLRKDIPVVADYHIYKNLIFAKRTLNEDDYNKYLAIYRILTADMAKPNILVYIQADLPTLLSRITTRARELEKNISKDYLEQLINDYETAMLEFEKQNPTIPILRLNGNKMDFVKNKADLESIIKKIATFLT